jgi:hypothetical protein
MSRALGTDRASRSSSGTTRVSPARTACEGLALGGEALGVGGAAGVADQRGGHVRQRTDSPPTSEAITGRAI